MSLFGARIILFQSGNCLPHVAQKFWLAVDDIICISDETEGLWLLLGYNMQTEYPQQNGPRNRDRLRAKTKESAAGNIAYLISSPFKLHLREISMGLFTRKNVQNMK